jgi:hypothetical protein
VFRLGTAMLRGALWMPIFTAMRFNPWLRSYYESPLNCETPVSALGEGVTTPNEHFYVAASFRYPSCR